jgi:hypothetical protein
LVLKDLTQEMHREEDRRMHARAAKLLAGFVVLLATGCGDGDKAERPSPTPPPSHAAGSGLSEDALLAVHDEFVTCVQDQDSLGIAAHYSGGRAVSDQEGLGGTEYDDRLSAPKTLARLTKAGKVQYVGLRADRTNRPGTPDLDVFIFVSESEAAAQKGALAQEAGASADQQGLFVSVPLHAAKAKFREASSKALTECEARAQAQAS